MAHLKFYQLLLILLFSLLSFAALSQLENFTPASISNTEKPRYPQDPKSENRETSLDDGLVELVFMVDETGKTFAPLVLRASMEKFVAPALAAIDGFRYEPAQRNGNPVMSKAQHTLKFKVTAADLRSSRGTQSTFTGLRDNGVPDGYQSYYDKFTKELSRPKPSPEKAQRLLNQMVNLKHQSFYSLAYHSLARFRFAEKFLSANDQITALNDLIWFDPYVEEKHQILTNETNAGIWSNLLKLQIESGRYAEALDSYAKLNTFDAKAATPFREYTDKIRLLQSSEHATQRAISLPEAGSQNVPLLKTSFMFADVKGTPTALKLRCAAKYAELEFVSDAKYQVPQNWGNCDLEISGNPGTTALLLEQ